MKKLLLVLTFLTSIYSGGLAQCTQPTNVALTTPSISTYTICQGTAQPLVGSVTVSSASQNGGFTYSWIKMGLSPSSDVVLQTATISLSINTPTVVPAYTGITGILTNSGKYILRVEDGNKANASCFNDDTITIAVQATVTSGAIGTSQTICSGSVPAALTETASAGGGTGIFSYAWETSVNAGGAYTPISSAINAMYSPGILINSGTTPMTIDYRRRAISGVCPQVAAPPIRITVNPSVVAGLIAPDQTICSTGDPVAFTQTIPATGGSGGYTYQWESSVVAVAGYTNIAGATNATYDPPAGLTTTTYYRRIDGSGTCATAKTNVVTVTVAAISNPIVTLSASTNTTICAGTSVTFTATPTNGGTAPTYEWFIGAVSQNYPSAAAGADKFTTTTLSNGDLVHVKMTSNSGCALAPGTVISNSITTTVNPVVIPTVSIAADVSNLCTNGYTTFTATPSNEGTVPIYEWSYNAVSLGPPSSARTFTTNVISSSFDVISVTLISNATCASPTTASASMSITINSIQTAGIIASEQIICYNSIPASITEITPATNIVGTPTYVWESSATVTGTMWTVLVGATNSTYSFTSPLTSDVYIRRVITDPSTSAPCNTTTSNVIHIKVLPQLVAGTIGSDETICSATATAIMNGITSPTGATGLYTYQWETSIVSGTGTFVDLSGETNSMYNAGPLTTTTYFRRMTTSGTCGSVTSNVVAKEVVSSTAATIHIDEPGATCSGDIALFKCQATNVGLTPKYNWYVNNNLVASISADVPDFNLLEPLKSGDELWVELISSSTCAITSSVISNKITVDIIPCTVSNSIYTPTNIDVLLQPYVSNSTPNVIDYTYLWSITGPFSTTITGPNLITTGQQNAVYSVANQLGFTYIWSVTGGTIVSGQNTNAVTVDWDGTTSSPNARTTSPSYALSVTETNSTNQTKTTTASINTLATGTTLSQAQSGIKLFPNPTTESFHIAMPESGVDVSYEILDLTGLSVASGIFTSTGSDQKIATNFGAGMYQVILKYNTVVTCVRLSKVH